MYPKFHSVRRREFLRLGSLIGFGVGLPSVLSPDALAVSAAGAKVKAKACVMVWLDGGPSHIDTFDPKPDAPAEVRGPFQAIQTSVPGVRVSELFPRIAQRMDQIALVRSLTSPLGEHHLGTQYLMTGYPPSPVIAYPPLVSSIAKHRAAACELGGRGGALPRSVAVPNFDVGGANLNPHGFLPPQFAPFSVQADPAAEDFAVRYLQGDLQNESPPAGSLERLERRRRFRASLAPAGQVDALTTQAFDLLRSRAARRAFSLDEESQAARDRYGRRTIGQSCLLARRLLEAGVPLVSVVHHGWDTHQALVTRLRDGFVGAKTPVGLAPSLDTALAALLDDLHERGLWEETLIVVMGEFGRTPKANAAGGRDHWPRVFSALLAGGPICGSAVIGASDRYGESPEERPVTPGDLAHTILAAMGIDARQAHLTADGRKIALADPDAAAIAEVLA